MSLADRLNTDGPRRGNRGCVTCVYYLGLPKDDRAAFDSWIQEGHSLTQLWEAASSTDPPLTVAVSALRNHVLHHKPA